VSAKGSGFETRLERTDVQAASQVIRLLTYSSSILIVLKNNFCSNPNNGTIYTKLIM